jgi:small-conductance mechanosensitive channel
VTYFGKILVLVNGAISLVFAFWAVSLYVHPTGWNDQVKELGIQIRDQLYSRDQAQLLYRDANEALAKLIDQRAKNLAVYGEALNAMDTGLDGMGQPAAEPVRSLQYTKGDLTVDPATFLPKFGDAPVFVPTKKPLEALVVYVNEVEKARTALAEKRAAVAALIDQDHALAAALTRSRDQLAEAQRRLRNSTDEELYLRPLVYNHQVERQLLEDRKTQLESRKRELEAVGSRSARQ